ncbi:MAG: hypothetical protein WA517_18030 [Candidatus Acidiferrum sp.]
MRTGCDRIGNHYAVLADALPRLDAPLESVLPNVREDVSVALEVLVDHFEFADDCVAHDYFFLNTKIGSVLKAPLQI